MKTGEKLLVYASKRIKNLVDMLTSKKIIVGVLAICTICYVTSLAKILAIGGIALGYVVIQGIIDIKKAPFED
jgi:hypothetical protein